MSHLPFQESHAQGKIMELIKYNKCDGKCDIIKNTKKRIRSKGASQVKQPTTFGAFCLHQSTQTNPADSGTRVGLGRNLGYSSADATDVVRVALLLTTC